MSYINICFVWSDLIFFFIFLNKKSQFYILYEAEFFPFPLIILIA